MVPEEVSGTVFPHLWRNLFILKTKRPYPGPIRRCSRPRPGREVFVARQLVAAGTYRVSPLLRWPAAT